MLLLPGLTPTSKNSSTASSSAGGGTAKSQCENPVCRHMRFRSCEVPAACHSGIEADTQQMGLVVQPGIGGELLLDGGKVAAHPYAVIRQWAARVDEGDQQCFATKLVDRNGLAALIEELEIRNRLPVVGTL